MSGRNEARAAEALKTIDSDWTAAQVGRALDGFHRRVAHGRRARRVSASVALVAVAAVIVLCASWRRSPSNTLAAAKTGSSTVLSPPAETPPVTTLAEGSTITSIDTARFAVRDVSKEHVLVALEGGKAGFSVSKRPEREFRVEVGAVRVIVVGTRFSVERQGERAFVHVDEGHVRVEWADGGRSLFAGDEGTFPPESTPETSADPATDAGVQGHHATGSDWRRLARQGAYGDAYNLMRRGGARAVNEDVEDLLLAADAARLSGRPSEALPYLERAETHARDARAPMAAFTRGRILLQLGRAAPAAMAFERSMALEAQGSLRENAMAHAVEAHGRAGNSAAATALAQTYVSAYPHGRWLASVRAYGRLDE